MITLSVELLVTIILATFGLVGTLVSVIRYFEKKRVDDLEKRIETRDKALQTLQGTLITIDKQVVGLNVKIDALVDLGHKTDDLRDDIGDIRETIAAFGAHYVTRKEFLDMNTEEK